MKKTYIQPSMKAYNVMRSAILAESNKGNQIPVSNGSGPSKVNEDAGRDVWSGGGNSVQW